MKTFLPVLLLLTVFPASLAEAQERAPRSRTRDLDVVAKAAVRRGLACLARQQSPNGCWNERVGYSFRGDFYGDEIEAVYATSLAGLAMAADGNMPGRGKYGRSVERSIDWLLSKVRVDGYISHAGSRMYSHALACLFLAEMVGMSRRQDIKQVVKQAVHLIVNSQNHEGGWRHQPIPVDGDLSVTVLVVQALRAARNVGVAVPEVAIKKAMSFVKSCATRRGYAYMPVYGYRSYGGRTTYAMTAGGIVSMYNLGQPKEPEVRKALTELLDRLESDPPGENHYFYAHFLAAQATYQAGEGYWLRYYPKIKSDILAMQDKGDGHWEDEVGIIYATSMACLILQMPSETLSIFQK